MISLSRRHWTSPQAFSWVRGITTRVATSSNSPAADSTLTPARAGTTPSHTSYLVLHATSPASAWPSHPPVHSPLLRDLTLALRPHGALVNFAHDHGPYIEEGVPQGQSLFNGHDTSVENYSATLYGLGGALLQFEDVSKQNIESVVNGVKDLSHSSKNDPRSPQISTSSVHPDITLYVCTHGARDCRCGTVGFDVFRILHSLSLSSSFLSPPASITPNISVREIAHVGGHAYAANVLVFNSSSRSSAPTGNWFGSVSPSPESSKAFLEAIVREWQGVSNLDDERLLWGLWRGRMGLTQEEQIKAHEESMRRIEVLDEEARGATSPSDEAIPRETKGITEDLVQLIFQTHEGVDMSVSAHVGRSIMEVGKKAGLPSIEGVCEGKLECATCHVYMQPPTDAHDLKLPPVSEEEEDMLEYALFREDQSRLGCQITVSKEMEEWCKKGGRIRLPRY